MRIFLTVLDSFGIGAAEDAALFGDGGTNTLKSLFGTGKLNIPNLTSLGLSHIDGVDYLPYAKKPIGVFGRLAEAGAGKDTTTGHWEIAGIISKSKMPTYPDGFPSDVISEFEKRVGIGTLCNLPYSGTEVILDFGQEHLATGKVIVYTSADSVFQIAAHESIYPPEKLYKICKTAREILTGKHAVGRVIARPFDTVGGKFVRTENRRDFSLPPPSDTLLDKLKGRGYDVISIGKINDIFAGKGITKVIPSHNNREGMAALDGMLDEDFNGLCFANLVDFDSNYGHRQNALGYALAVNDFDIWLGKFIEKMADGDILIITADHGCDPSDNSTDHTREYTPVLAYRKGITAKNIGTGKSFCDIGATVSCLLTGENLLENGESFAYAING